MINKLFEWSLTHRYTVILVFCAIITLGVYSMTQLPIDAVPDITNVSVMVNTRTGALAPEEIERNVTFPIETELAGLKNDELAGIFLSVVMFAVGTDATAYRF